MKVTVPLLLLALPAAGLLSAAVPAPGGAKAVAAAARAPAVADSYQTDMAPKVRKYCGACHGVDNPPSGLPLLGYRDTAGVVQGRDVWVRVANILRAQTMPPAGKPQPTPQERQQMVDWIEETLASADCKLADPGRVTMRRLNREEYNNTIHDLFGINLRPADTFPTDDVGYGFDNIGDVLSISPLLMEKYLAAAEQVARAVILTPETAGETTRFENETLAQAGGAPYGTARVLTKAEELSVEQTFPRAGEYVVRARVFSQPAGPEAPRMAVRLDGKDVQTYQVRATENDPDVDEIRLKAPAGKHHLSIAFLNPFTAPGNGFRQRPRPRGLVVAALEIQGPMGMPRLLPIWHRRVMIAQPTSPGTQEACARRILSPLARRAFRRPPTKEEVDGLVRIAGLATNDGDSFERGIQLAVQAILVSPQFLFRVEIDPKPNDPKASRLLNSYEMASRLSYFLWSSMPDEELLTLAAKGKLQDPAMLASQVRRMLKDVRARALARNFGAQWLTLRRLGDVSPDPKLFPDFNEEMREAMRTETERFFEAIVQEDHSVLDFLDARFTYLNETLARHYGIAGITGPQFRRVELTGSQREGILTQASILTVTSNPTRTSPVKRGKWVLEQILGTPPPPPPPDVPALVDDNKQQELKGTLRQRMEQHRANPMCASCHAPMDPLGFGLENFDAVGRWRTRDGDSAVDASGEMPGGKRFNGPMQLIGILKLRQDQFVRNLTEKLLTYAIGRGVESTDNCNLKEIVQRVAREDNRFSALVTEIVLSDPFRKRRGDGGQK